MEKYGYDKDYVLYCIKNNVLCHALTVFYLLKNYKDIEWFNIYIYYIYIY